MATQEITSIKLVLTSDIKQSDLDKADDLLTILNRLEKAPINDRISPYLKNLGNAVKSFNGIKISAGLGKGITNLTESLNGIENVKDISPYAENIKRGFSILNEATKAFIGNGAKISAGLGKGTAGIVEAINSIGDVRDISKQSRNINNGFRVLASATSHFKDNNASVGANIGKGVTSLVTSINSIENVKDIKPYAEQIKSGFVVLSQATKVFEGNNAKISVNLGRSISGLIKTMNDIKQVQDISPYAQNIKRGAKVLSDAVSEFSGMRDADYTGISRLVTAMTSIGKVKKLDDSVIKNASQLAKAINILDAETKASTPRLAELGTTAKVVGNSFQASTGGVNKFGGSLKLLNFDVIIRGIRSTIGFIDKLTRAMLSTVSSFGEVQNTMSFFTQSMGSQAGNTADLIQQYADFGAVDFTHFADQTAKLNQMYKGYGISAENAAKMALNMTHLSYDASFALGQNGKDIELWNQRATSFATGQTRSGYFFGVDASVKALSEEFEGLTSQTDKASRAMASYELLLKNTTAIQGQLPREFQNSYVQMQVFQNRLNQLKQSIGQALVPAFQVIIQWGLVALKVVERVIAAVARLFGRDFQLINYSDIIKDMESGMGGVDDASQGVADSMKDANKQAKELRKTVSGIDQVFTINDEKPADKSNNTGGGSIAGLGGDLSGYDWLEALGSAQNIEALKNVEEAADKIVEKIRKIIPLAITIGGLFAAWKVLNLITGLSQAIGKMNDVSSILGSLGTIVIGVGLALVGFELFKAGLKKLMDGDVTWTSIGMTVGGAIIAGIGVAMIAKGGVGLLAKAFPTSSLATWATTTGSSIGGFIQVGIGIGLVVGGLALVFTGFKDAFENGFDWKNIGMIVGGTILAGLGVAFTVSSIKKILDGANAGTPVAESISGTLLGSETTVSKASDGASKLTGKLKDLATNLFWVGVIIAEVVVIGAIFVGGIALIGILLQQVIKAWEPVLEDGDTALIAVGLGTGLLVAIGGASYLLGTSGKTVASNIALGSAMLILIEASAILFIGAIALIGYALDGLGKAWQPVLTNGSTITAGIALGTTLLVAIGLASFALGTATVASAGSIPIAIGIGTAMLVLLTGATVLFIQEMKLIADQLANQLAPSLARLNEIMPGLSEHMRVYTFFMIEFAGHVLAQTASNAVSGLSGAINKIIGWFTKDPIKSMADDAKKNIKQFESLKSALETVNPLVKRGNELMIVYMDLLAQLYDNAKKASSLGTMPSIGVQFKDFSRSLRDGFKDLDGIKTNNVAKIMEALRSIDLTRFRGIGTSIVQAMEMGINNYSFNLNSAVSKIKTGLTFNGTSIGTGIANTTLGGINNSYVNINTFSNKIRNGLTFSGSSIGSSIANSVVSGINGSNANVNSFKNRVYNGLGFSSYGIGTDIARGVQNGINGFYPNTTLFTNRLKRGLQVSFKIFSPSRWGRDFIGGNIGLGVVDGVNETDIDFNPFKRNVTSGMYDIIDDIDTNSMNFTPTVDTSRLSGDITGVTRELNAKVSSYSEFNSDGTERAIRELIEEQNERMDALIKLTEQGKNIILDGEKVGSNLEERSRNKEINSNTVFK